MEKELGIQLTNKAISASRAYIAHTDSKELADGLEAFRNMDT